MKLYSKYVFLLSCIIGLSLVCYAQTQSELLKYGELYFKNKNYANSAFFYGEYINKASKNIDLIYPYEFHSWIKESKQIKQDSSVQDSDNTDSLSHGTAILTSKNYQMALYKLGISYFFSPNYDKAEETFKSCKLLDTALFPHTQYWYGLSLRRNMKYKEAVKEFQEYSNRISSQQSLDSLSMVYLQYAEKYINSCNWAYKALANPVNGVKIEKSDTTINGSSSQFSASFAKNENEILFTSLNMSGKVHNYSYDLYTSKRIDSSNWSNRTRFSNIVNSIYHDATPFMSKDGTKLFFTRWDHNQQPKVYSIYLSRFFNGQWLQPQMLSEEINLTGYNSMHPFLSDDGSILYYTSDRPGGKGKLDIWYCTIDEYGNAGEPNNLGNAINTPEDEGTPHYSEMSNTLFFSSKGHMGFGGFDIFQSYGTFGNFHPPENLGSPINSGGDDQYFVLNDKENYGFFTSDYSKCEECNSDVACYSIFQVDYGPPKFTLSGHVYSLLDNTPISNALITLKDKNGFIEPFFIITDESGYYFSPLRRETAYNVKAQKVRYFADAKNVSTIGLEKSTDLVHDFYLPLIPVGEIEIKGIFYDYDKWDLREESKVTLDSLVYFLNINNNIIIELSSHTDSRGDASYNMKLSQKRAQSVVDYLIFKGIPKGRLKPMGYGESMPRIGKAETEEEHQQNRRTAFKVIGEDFVELRE